MSRTTELRSNEGVAQSYTPAVHDAAFHNRLNALLEEVDAPATLREAMLRQDAKTKTIVGKVSLFIGKTTQKTVTDAENHGIVFYFPPNDNKFEMAMEVAAATGAKVDVDYHGDADGKNVIDRLSMPA